MRMAFWRNIITGTRKERHMTPSFEQSRRKNAVSVVFGLLPPLPAEMPGANRPSSIGVASVS
jgi:hypothetical protein